MRELIHFHIGQAGVGIGSAQWELYCEEHGIAPNGSPTSTPTDPSLHPLFYETADNKFIPRSIFIDTDPDAYLPLRRTPYRSLFHPDRFISGKEDSASNFVRAYYTIGREILEPAEEQIRRVVEQCDSLEGFIVNHGISGGTGSGVACRILERIAMDYSKVLKITSTLVPSNRYGEVVVSPYNAVMTFENFMEVTDLSFMLDNETLYNILVKIVGLNAPSFSNINKLIAQIMSSVTACSRYSGTGLSLQGLLTNLVPFPMLHFPMITYAPLKPANSEVTTPPTAIELTEMAFDPKYVTLDCDPFKGKYISTALIYRGFPMSDVESAIEMLRGKGLHFIVQNQNFKYGIVDRVPFVPSNSDLASQLAACTLINNNCGIKKVFQRMMYKWDGLYSKRAFVHWFVGEGIRSRDMPAGYHTLEGMIKDYEEVANEL